MNVQQAPSPVQAALLSPPSVAFTTAQSMKGGTATQTSATTRIVRRLFQTELKRLRRSQSSRRATLLAPPPIGPMKPPLVDAGISVMPAARSPLHQRDA